MSDDSIDIEQLPNKELRKMCLQYGLPNVPITDTSKKILIKRLRNAIENGAKPEEKAKSRRETIHVANNIKVDENLNVDNVKKTRTNRRTISVTPDVEPASVPAPITTRRRSGRITPINNETILPPAAKKNIIIEEESDEEKPSRKIQIERKSRSPSLSKSETITTSYKNVSVPKTIEESDYFNHEPLRVLDSPRKTINTYTRKSSPVVNPLPKSRYSAVPLNQTSYSKSYYPDTTSTINRNLTKSATLLESVPSYQRNTYAYSTESENDDIISEAPFLSDFARRLSRIKADPLNPRMPKETADLTGRTAQFSNCKIIQNNSIGDSFKLFWEALDKKYNVKKILIFSFMMSVIYIYIKFFK